MARWSNFNGSGKTITVTAAQTISFTGNDMPSSGVVAYHVVTTGANNNLTNITRLRLKADGQTIYDVDTTHFRKWFERFTQANTAPSLTNLRFTIPVNFCDIIDDDLADVCQFPPGTVPTLEIVTGAGTSAGSAFVGWTQTDQECHFTPMLLGQAMNIAASQTQSQYPLTVPGDAMIRGFTIVDTNLAVLRMELNQFLYHQQIGPLYLAATTGDMVLEGDSWEDPASITTHGARRIPMISPTPGTSRLLLDTGAGYSAANEVTLWMARGVQS
jgi:hypothetical protein